MTDLAVEWLRSHHYSDILMPEKTIPYPQISHSFSDRKVALAVAMDMKADFVLFLEREQSKEGALIEAAMQLPVSCERECTRPVGGKRRHSTTRERPLPALCRSQRRDVSELDLPGLRDSVGIPAIRATRYSV